MKFGIPLGRVNARFFTEITLEADRLGFESVWFPEHLVLPVEMSRSPHPGQDHPPIPKSKRPLETTSSVCTARATTNGWRRPML